ncbi:MAG: phosphoglucosamine mutase [Candidatus Kapaibacterium sp.]
MPLIRSISGVRATLGDSCTPDVIAAYVMAYAAVIPPGPIVVGRDGRPSGAWMESVVLGALAACGRTVRSAGIVPTPTVQLLTEKSDAVGGIIITASHNPAQWNGLKFLDGDGTFLDAEANARLWAVLDAPSPGNSAACSSLQQAGLVERVDDAIARHIDAVLAMPLFTPDALQTIRDCGLRVVVDAVNCSGSFAVPSLLRTMGVEVVELSCDGTGVFPHAPEPLTENLGDLRSAVLHHRAHAGFAVDPDADRLVVIDHRGEAIGEERTVMLAIEAVMRNAATFTSARVPTAVVNMSTSRMAADAAARHGGRCEMAPVGEINVVRAMQRHDACVGGEGSGGVIVPTCHYGRDSLVGCALVVWLMAHCSEDEWKTLTVSEPYCMIKTKFEVAERPTSFDVVLRDDETSDVRISYEDGVRVDWSDAWVQLRASNTEPIVRIIAEAPTRERAEALVGRAKEWV